MTEADLYCEYKGVYVPKQLHPPECLKYYEDFTFRPDDVLIVTFPKSGTTWMQEIVPLIHSEGDLTPVHTIPNWDRAPWLEDQRAIQLNLEQKPSPRIFTTHFHHSMMNESYFKVKPKVIYVIRNPKDVFTSSFYFYGMAPFLVNPGTADEFLEKFLNSKIIFGSWFEHVKGWLSAKDQDHIFYISYEELIQDLKGSVTKIAQFLEKPLSPEVIDKIAENCLFKNMKQNKMSNYSLVPVKFMDQKKSKFFRKGIAGDWKNLLTEAQVEKFNTFYKESMKDVKYNFVWD
ncbi:sulfotransferase family 2, cytosolic sulfotransferase 2 [Silurus asotus]|uniref:Sulfotransferase n=1 Tax=Silurus asotus TaxID=30991 RepID=A0AAD5FTC9_SILAS|nr:sulfotransferase family 2, cytosolic sulfotransferase 2 [Silurus asotus]